MERIIPRQNPAPLELSEFEQELVLQSLVYVTGRDMDTVRHLFGASPIIDQLEGEWVVENLEHFANALDGMSRMACAGLLGKVLIWLKSVEYNDPLEVATGHGRR